MSVGVDAEIAQPPSTSDELVEIRATDDFLCRVADAVPLESWGFDVNVLKAAEKHKQQLIKSKMSRRDIRHTSHRHKQQLARADDRAMCNTVTQIWRLAGNNHVNLDAVVKDATTVDAEKAAAANKRAAGTSRSKKNRKDQKRLRKQKEIDGNGTTVNGTSMDARADALWRLKDKLKHMKEARSSAGKCAVDAVALQDESRLKRRISKIKLKQRRAVEKQAKNDRPKTVNNTGENTETKKEPSTAGAARADNNQLIRNQEGKLVFSKFDFALSPAARAVLPKGNKRKRTSSLGNGDKSVGKKSVKLSGRDYGRLLDKVNSRQAKVEKLRAKNETDKADRLEQNIKWVDVMQKASGQIVKNDPVLLKAALKKKEKRKEQKAKKWEKRIAAEKQQQQKRQEKRKRNIDKRKEKKKKTKLMKSAKRRS